jgi:hypothetical protein
LWVPFHLLRHGINWKGHLSFNLYDRREVQPKRLTPIEQQYLLCGHYGDADRPTHAVGVDRRGDYGGDGDNAAGTPDFKVGGIEPEVGPFASSGWFRKSIHASVDLGAMPRDLVFGDAGHSHCLDEIIHGAG